MKKKKGKKRLIYSYDHKQELELAIIKSGIPRSKDFLNQLGG